MRFVPSTLVVDPRSPAAPPTRTAFVLHGILGSGRNWRTLARQLAGRHPHWRFVLVDLRNHGDSAGAPPPHTVTTAADDLLALHEAFGAPDAVIGHSFGGKVALRYAARHPDGLHQCWVLDSLPGVVFDTDENDVTQVIRALRGFPPVLDRRDTVREGLVAGGFSPGLAQWMTTNLARQDDGTFTWRFDLDAIEAMITDYFELDLFPVLEAPPVDVHLVRAGRSDRWDAGTLEHLADVVARCQDVDGPKVAVHLLEHAGHWVHVDDPEGLMDTLGPSLDALR